MIDQTLELWQRNVFWTAVWAWREGRLDADAFERVVANLLTAPDRAKRCGRCGRRGHNISTCENHG